MPPLKVLVQGMGLRVVYLRRGSGTEEEEEEGEDYV